jgi:hypothetical protein
VFSIEVRMEGRMFSLSPPIQHCIESPRGFNNMRKRKNALKKKRKEKFFAH